LKLEPGVYTTDVSGHLVLLQREPYQATCLVCVETCAEKDYQFSSQFAGAAMNFVDKHGGLKDKIAETVLDLVK
jgi:hypothetical protein